MGFESIAALERALLAQDYLPQRGLATALYLSLAIQKPLLLEGEAGVGKTEAAKALAGAAGARLIRLQCYEGLDVSHAVYEWNYPRQLMHLRRVGQPDEATEEGCAFVDRYERSSERSSERRGDSSKGAFPRGDKKRADAKKSFA